MAISTLSSAKAWSPDLHTFAPHKEVPDALILQTSVVAGVIHGDEPVVRVAYVDDDEAGFVPEGEEIPEADPELAEVTVSTGKIAQLLRISREQYMQRGTTSLLSDSIRRAVVKAANQAYIAQPAPTGGAVTPPAGLLNIDGVIDGGNIGDDLDAIADALTTIDENGGDATHIVASPSAWNTIRKLKTGSGSAQTLLGAGTGDLERRLLGLPVLTSSAVPTGELIVLDRNAIASAVGQIQLTVSDHRYFEYDSIAVRATWRFGQNLVHPEHVVTLSTGDGS